MTYEIVKHALAYALEVERETDVPQAVMVPAKLMHLILNVVREADTICLTDPTGEPSWELVEALQAVDDYEMEREPCLLLH